MVAYNLELHDTWDHGLWLVGVDDKLPDGALRYAWNARIDRLLGALTNRPGSTQRTAAAISATHTRGLWLASLFGTSTDYRYTQVSDDVTTQLVRLNAAWQAPTLLLAGLAATPFSDVNWVDGKDGIWKYLAGPTLRKDNGVSLQNFGIAAPTNPPQASSLGTRRRTVINTCDRHEDWTGTNVGGKGNDGNVRQEGSASLTFTVAASTLGSVGASLGTLDIDSFDIGIFAGVATGGSSVSLIDTGRNFRDAGATEGMIVELPLGGQRGTITAISTTTNLHDTLHVSAGFTPATTVTAGTNYTIINDLVKDDDYIYLWVRVDFPERLEWLQVDFDLDTDTLANAFRTNYYTLRVPSSTRLNQGRDVWTELKLRKSSFLKIGTGTATWSAVHAVRVSYQTTSEGAITVFMDDLSLVGGYGIEGEIEYTVCYENFATGCRGNPALDSRDPPQALFTAKVTADRHPVTVNMTNISSPSDGQITRLLLYRKGGTLVTPRLVARINTAVPVYEDYKSETELSLAPPLETDNDLPPPGALVVAGPGAYIRLFFLVAPNRVYVSKPWERDESRGENVPPDNFFLVGDGSQTLQNLYVKDTTILAWTTDATWQVIGQGSGTAAEIFLPVAIPQSRGLAARFALTDGDGRVFFLARDGVYQHVGLVQQKLTGSVDPLFEGQTVNGVAPLNQSAIAQCRLQFYPSPQGGMLVLLYPDAANTRPNRRLVLKKNWQTHEYTDVFPDFTTSIAMQAVHVDAEANELIVVGDNARIYQLEVDTVDTDDGALVDFAFQQKAHNQGLPRHEKSYLDVVVQANTTGVNLTTTAYYNLGVTTESLGNVTGTTDISQTQLTSTSTATRRNIGLRIAGLLSAPVRIFKIGWHWLAEAEDVTVLDTDEISFPTRHILRHLLADYDSPVAITAGLFLDGSTTATETQTIALSTGRQRLDLLLSNTITPASLRRAMNFRWRLTATSPFQVYALTGMFEPEPQLSAWYDTRLIHMATRRKLRHLFYDIDAPAAVTVTLYLDGSTTATEAKTLSATAGRQRVDQLWSDTATASLLRRGRAFQVTLSSSSAFQLWSLSGAFEVEPLQVTWWDSPDLSFDDIQNLQRLHFDVDAPSAITVTTYIDGLEGDSRALAATTNRQRRNLDLPAGLKGRFYRATLLSSSAFQVYGLVGRFKAWGSGRGWNEQRFFAQQTGLQDHNFMTINTQLVERRLLQVA